MKGDGIGPEIVDATLDVLTSVQDRFRFNLEYFEVPAGDASLRQNGEALPKSSEEEFERSDACLKGPVGETVMEINTRLRFGYDLYANIRPARSFPGICPPALRPDTDLVVIRENSEGFYKALEMEIVPGVWVSSGVFTTRAAQRIARLSFEYARNRARSENSRAKVTLATKANIFRMTHGMYLREFQKMSLEYPDVVFEHMYADAVCAALVRDSSKFDVISGENLLGDLLSDLAGQICGGLGMTPGTNINYETKQAYFEPTHGCAPDIAGKGIANPIGQIRSAALMLDYLSHVNQDPRLKNASLEIELAIEKLLSTPNRTSLPVELGGTSRTDEVGRIVSESIVK